jgi:hypothetical protein
VFTAPLNTLTNGDNLDGGAGEDSLSVELTGNVSNLVTVTDIESVSLEVLAGASTVDAANFSGVTEYVSNGVGALTLNNLNGTAATLVKEGNNSALTANYVTSSVAGGADTVNIELKGSTGGLITLGAGVENVVVNSASGDTSVAQLTAPSANSLTVKGGGTVTLGSAAIPINTTFTTIDARDTAAVTLNAAGSGATAASYLTGAGDDSLTINSDIGLAANLVSMGEGTDTLVLNASQTATTASTLVGVENVRFAAAGPNLLDLANSSGDIAFDVRAGGAITLNNAQAGISLAATTAGILDDVTVAYRAGVTGETFTLNADRAQTTTGTGITVTNAEAIVLNYNSDTASNTTFGGIVLDSTATGTDVTKSLTINANGAGAVTQGAITETGAASALENLTVNATGAAVTVGGMVSAQALTNVTAVADAGAVTLGALGGTAASTKLDVVDLTAKASNIIATGTDINAANTAGVSTVKLAATGGDIGQAAQTFDIANTAGNIADVTISGSKDVFATLTAGTAATTTGVVSTVDASSATGSLTLTINNNSATGNNVAGSTVTLGNAGTGEANNLTIAGPSHDTIIGGTGDDTINAGAGADSITLNGGDNAITQGAAGNGAAGDGMVGLFADKDGDGAVSDGDTLTFANGVDLITGFKVATNGTTAIDTLTIDSNGGTALTAGTGLTAGAVADNTYETARGDYSNGVFTFNAASGADLAVIYDGDNAATTVSSETVVLTGIGAAGLTAAVDLLLV